MNPPYSQGLGTRFLKHIILLGNRVVSVQPATWLFGKKKPKDLVNILNKAMCNFEIIDAPKYFDAGFLGYVTVNDIDMTDNNAGCTVTKEGTELNKYFNDINDISLLKLNDKLYMFNNCIEHLYKEDNLHNHLIHMLNKTDAEIDDYERKRLYGFRISGIRGHVNQQTNEKCEDFYTIISNNRKEIDSKVLFNTENIKQYGKNGKLIYGLCWLFDTEQEQLNFFNYIQTDFCRACLSTIKNNHHLDGGELRYIPWFDFSDSVFNKTPKEIDDYLFKKYNISNDIRKYIEEFLPDYYNIRK